jgi:hypothetical protein
MIDAPIVIRARKLVERARLMGILPGANPVPPASVNAAASAAAGKQEAKA